ncbi:Target of rapamycin complex 2 subunit MAPKAP1-like Protein [Tribolium castaneum]|uniref:Target of rapamycin complex 2 subunit MAPKAP1-like Protein n=2 Tax=Tribolium castaneum TaxID=7070 RepID=D6WD06_TRICA|nr:Target of rapamycin complex 2 subunit MAPKAP1-like Protein [Tribolium castaneum]
MALYDNKYWLLSHIRNSFISTDDTGMCELIMTGEEGVRKHLKQSLDSYPDDEDSEDEDDLSHESYDLQLDTDFPLRYRSNTAVRLEKLEQVKKRTGRIKHIKWETNKNELSEEQIDQLFVKKEPKVIEPKQSLFSKTFKEHKMMPINPYMDYAKFDGSGQVNLQVKKYRIFLTMLPEHQRNYPLAVCCTSSAKIQELIGLILLKCSTMYEDYPWKPVNNYGLYITEEDGEVDRDFPNLDPRENIAKFGFACLGLVEHSDPSKCVSFGNSETVTIRKFDYNDKKGKDSSKQDQEKQITTDLHLMDVHKKAMEAPLYKSFKVYMINKMRAKVEIHLGISGEKIEIDPVQKNSKFVLVKQKPINHDMDMIAWCEPIETTKSNKMTFKIIYSHSFANAENVSSPTLQSSASFKSYEFEADQSIAEEIVNKINLILDLRSSDTRKEYLAAQERKYYKKKALI